MEYEYALSQKKPIIAFLHSDPGKIASEKTDPANLDRLNAFRELAQKKMCKFWSSPKELGSVVSRSIVKLIKEKPGTGWVRANFARDESAAQEILCLRERIVELEKQVSDSAARVPQGTEDLAHGEDIIEVTASFMTRNQQFVSQRYPFTWDQLLAILGPHLLSPVNEDQLREKLGEAINHSITDQGGYTSHLSVRDEDFQQIKIQFRALGIIRGAEKPGEWALTPYGDALTTRVAAIRKLKPAAKS
jgi:hypothetical protein